jgi:hypothetical protein
MTCFHFVLEAPHSTMQLLRGPEKNVSNIYISPAISGFGTVKTVIMLYCCFLIKT